MARPIRIEYENAFYHITSRGNARGRIYLDDFDRDMFLDAVKATCKRFGFNIHAFVLMAASEEFGVAREDVFKSNRGGIGVNARRGLALYVLNRHSGMTQKEIGVIAGGMSRAAVGQAVQRFEKTLAEDAQAKRIYGRITS